MSYYILPKLNYGINIHFFPLTKDNQMECFINHTLCNYLKQIKNVYKKLLESEDNQFVYEKIEVEDLLDAVNPYEFIFKKVPSLTYSISKFYPSSNTFFEFIEVSQTVNLFEAFQKKDINYNSFGKNATFIAEYMNIFREDKNDTLENTIEEPAHPILDFIYYELGKDTYQSNNDYIIGLMDILQNICIYQKIGGVCVIKIMEMYYKPIVDIFFIISSLYEKCYLIKPNASNILTQDKYLVCKNFRSLVTEDFKQSVSKTIECIHGVHREKKFIKSLIKNNISCYFLTKLEECNIIIGQQQIEYLDKVINILKNKNRLDKIDALRKSNIQKCILWCEKYKIPCNKLNDRVNIFLTPNSITEIGFTGSTGLIGGYDGEFSGDASYDYDDEETVHETECPNANVWG